jgi:predicted AlkP superfamily pyrophosphatase or phosphodiesterase
MPKLLVIQVAALGHDLVDSTNPMLGGRTWRAVQSVFPALTCTAQGTLRTAAPPGKHGMVSNGKYFPELAKPLFWEQSSNLVTGPRIWDEARSRDLTVGMMFWQQSLGESVDLVLSPKPIHKHGGGMIQNCYCKPRDLSERLAKRIGKRFNLVHYWGPLASRKSTEWIIESLEAVLCEPDWAPDLLLGYLPHLDYDLQRHGPGSTKVEKAVGQLDSYLSRILATASSQGYEVFLAGDYAIGGVSSEPVFPNRVLREAGLFEVTRVGRRAYPDFFGSDAFAMVDHEIAHIHVRNPQCVDRVRELLSGLPGVDEVLDAEAQRTRDVLHASSGTFLAVAKSGSWFAYPWWTERNEEPDFASHVDIHNKPGFDPCELFFGWPPPGVSRDPGRIRGSHGRGGPDRAIAWTSTFEVSANPATFLELAAILRHWIQENS